MGKNTLIVILFSFINEYLFGSNLTAAASTSQVALAMIKMIIFTIFGFQLMKLSSPIAKALGGGTAGISTGEGSAIMKSAAAGGLTAAAGGAMIAGAALKTVAGGIGGGYTGLKDSENAGGGGFSQFGNTMLGAAKGASQGFQGSSLAEAAKKLGSSAKNAIKTPSKTLTEMAASLGSNKNSFSKF